MPTPWLSYEGVDVFQVGSAAAYTYKTAYVSLDADGSPRAYHPDNTGLDHLLNAGYPNAAGGRCSQLIHTTPTGRMFSRPGRRRATSSARPLYMTRRYPPPIRTGTSTRSRFRTSSSRVPFTLSPAPGVGAISSWSGH